MSTIYFIQFEDGVYKVGMTKQIKKRLKHLKNVYKKENRMIYVTNVDKNPHILERLILEKLREKPELSFLEEYKEYFRMNNYTEQEIIEIIETAREQFINNNYERKYITDNMDFYFMMFKTFKKYRKNIWKTINTDSSKILELQEKRMDTSKDILEYFEIKEEDQIDNIIKSYNYNKELLSNSDEFIERTFNIHSQYIIESIQNWLMSDNITEENIEFCRKSHSKLVGSLSKSHQKLGPMVMKVSFKSPVSDDIERMINKVGRKTTIRSIDKSYCDETGSYNITIKQKGYVPKGELYRSTYSTFKNYISKEDFKVKYD